MVLARICGQNRWTVNEERDLRQNQCLTAIQRRSGPQRTGGGPGATGKSDPEGIWEPSEKSASSRGQCPLHLAPRGSQEQLERTSGSHHTRLQGSRVYRK